MAESKLFKTRIRVRLMEALNFISKERRLKMENVVKMRNNILNSIINEYVAIKNFYFQFDLTITLYNGFAIFLIMPMNRISNSILNLPSRYTLPSMKVSKERPSNCNLCNRDWPIRKFIISKPLIPDGYE